MAKKSWWELSSLDQMAVQAVAYQIVSSATTRLEGRKAETRYHVLEKTIDGLQEILAAVSKELADAPTEEPTDD